MSQFSTMMVRLINQAEVKSSLINWGPPINLVTQIAYSIFSLNLSVALTKPGIITFSSPAAHGNCSSLQFHSFPPSMSTVPLFFPHLKKKKRFQMFKVFQWLVTFIYLTPGISLLNCQSLSSPIALYLILMLLKKKTQ